MKFRLPSRRYRFRMPVYGRNKLATPSFGTPISGRSRDRAAKVRAARAGCSAGADHPLVSCTYVADLIMGLLLSCEGPINSIGFVYKNQSIFTLLGLGLGNYDGTTPQTKWYLAALYPYNALAYQGTAYVWGGATILATPPRSGLQFLGLGRPLRDRANGTDADPAQVIYDFLTNATSTPWFFLRLQRGLDHSRHNPFRLGRRRLPADLLQVARALPSRPSLDSQEPASSILTRWLQLLNCAAVWSGGELKFIPYGDSAISNGASTDLSEPILDPDAGPAFDRRLAFVRNAWRAASQFVSRWRGCLRVFSGFRLSSSAPQVPTATGTYGMIVERDLHFRHWR